MSIEKHLEKILESVAANRPADNTSSSAPAETITADITKKGGIGGDTKRPADKKGNLDEKPVTAAKTETDKEEKAPGTEVQGNKNGGLSESIKDRIATSINESVDFKLDLSAIKNLMETQELTEEFQSQAISIFEAAVTDVAKTQIGKICEMAESLVEAELEQVIVAMNEETKIAVQAAITEWKEENQVAIDSGIRTTVAESFMAGLADLLMAHNVKLDEESVDLYEVAISEGESLAETYEIAIAEGENLLQENLELRKRLALSESTATLSKVQAEKIMSISESIEFVDEESFKSQIRALAEGYVKAIDGESLTEDTTPVDTTTVVEQVIEAEDQTIAALHKRIKSLHV